VKKVVIMIAVLVSLVATSSAQATFQGGGKKPSEAATIEWGQHYVGELDNHSENANYLDAGGFEVAFWRVPAISTRDQLVVNWQSVPTKSGYFPVYMYFVQGVNDSNWGELFEHRESAFELSGSGTAASAVTVQDTDAGGSSYLEFVSRAGTSVGDGGQETFQYNFTVEQPRHYLSMALPPFTEVAANGIVNASVTRSDGSAAPDGLTFGLTVRWSEGGTATYTATSAGGHVAFQLALPESVYKKSASFIGGRGADGEYQAVETPVTRAKVTEPPPPPAPPVVKRPLPKACKKANARVRVIARLHHRTATHWHRARGVERLRLHRRARILAGKLHRAKARAKVACA
jgi:hypothetical protein